MSKRVVHRGPATAQQSRGNTKTAFDISLMRGNFNTMFSRGPLFNTPTPEPTPEPNPEPTPKADPIEERFQQLEKKLNAAHATIRKLSEPKQTPVDPEPVKPSKVDPKEAELASRLAKLEEQSKATEKARQTLAQNAKRNQVRERFAALGLEDNSATGEMELTDRVDLFMMRNGDKLIHDEENGTVQFKHSDLYDPIPITEWFQQEDKAGKFKHLKAAKSTPTSGPNKSAQGAGKQGVKQISEKDIAVGKYNPAELKKALAGDPAFELVP